jgi:hypothetical protein
MKGKINPAAQAYVAAVTDENLQALVDSFAPNATIIDVSRTISGHVAIETWARNEVIGGSLEVLEITDYPGGQDLLVRFSPKDFEGFRAHYRFDFQEGKIVSANLQYA